MLHILCLFMVVSTLKLFFAYDNWFLFRNCSYGPGDFIHTQLSPISILLFLALIYLRAFTWNIISHCNLMLVKIIWASERSEPITMDTLTAIWMIISIFSKILQYLIPMNWCITILRGNLRLLLYFHLNLRCLFLSFSLLFSFKLRRRI